MNKNSFFFKWFLDFHQAKKEKGKKKLLQMNVFSNHELFER